MDNSGPLVSGTVTIGLAAAVRFPFVAPPHLSARQLTFVTYSRTSRSAPVVGGWLRLALVWYQRVSVFRAIVRFTGRRPSLLNVMFASLVRSSLRPPITR